MDPDENPVVESESSAGDMPDECTRCGKRLEDFVHIVYFGEWAADSFKNEPAVRGWCRSCWGDHRAREKAAHYEVDDPERLWDILEAADGRLVADLKHLFIGGRPYARVVDGSLQVVHPEREVSRPEDEDGDVDEPSEAPTIVIKHSVEHADVDRDWFDEVMANNIDGDRETIALVKPVEETPFGDVRDRGGKSRKLSKYGAV